MVIYFIIPIAIIENILLHPTKLKNLKKQARISSEAYSLKYFAEQVQDVYYKAIGDKPKDKKFFDKIISIVKGGFHGK